VTRDPRSVAVSAFHMFKKIDSLKTYMEKYNLKDVNSFAKHFFEENIWCGTNTKFDSEFQKYFSQNSKLNVLWLKYEGKF
jgi:hypothetical protein